MQYLKNEMNLEILFYIGALTIVFIDAWLVLIYFKGYDEISLKEHFWIIIVYIGLLILALYAWRYFFDYFFSEKLINILQSHNQSIKDIL